MKILIVNAQPETPTGLKQFLEFRYLVQKSFMEQRELMDTDMDYIIRDTTSIVEFLYENQSSYVNHHASTSFEQFDMVFISAAGTVLPWHSHMERILVLLRMCLRMKKYLFASSSSMQGLVFLSASNFDRTIYMVNPNGEPNINLNGQDLGEANGSPNTSQITMNKQNNNKYFIERITGDIYTYHQDSQQWLPKANAGLHNSKAAQEFQVLGKYIMKAPVYRPKLTLANNGDDVFVSKTNEVVVYIKTEHLNHYAFQGISKCKFISSTEAKWDIHTFTFTSPERAFRVLAGIILEKLIIKESDRGPMIIEYGTYILATLFDINKQYLDTTIPLKNFISQTISKISLGMKIVSNTSQKKSILQAQSNKTNQRVFPQQRNLNIQLLFSKFTNTPTPVSRRSYEEEGIFKHSGFAIKKDAPKVFYKSSQINTKGIKVRQLPIQKHIKIHTELQEEEQKYNRNIFSQRQSTSNIRSQNFVNEFDGDIQYKFFDRSQIRQLLHPDMVKDVQECESLWVPGYVRNHIKSKSQTDCFSHQPSIRNHFQANQVDLQQINEDDDIIIAKSRKLSIVQRPFTNFKKFRELTDQNPNYNSLVKKSKNALAQKHVFL